MDDAPVIFPCHGIKVALAQEALIVRCLHELIDGVGITAVFSKVDTDGASILLPPVHSFNFLVAAYRFRHLGGRDGQGEQNQQDHEQHPEQQETVFMFGTGLRASVFHCRRGSVCVLWYGMSSTWTDAELIFTTR